MLPIDSKLAEIWQTGCVLLCVKSLQLNQYGNYDIHKISFISEYYVLYIYTKNQLVSHPRKEPLVGSSIAEADLI